jgi:preprotein translocase subunit SecE
VAKAVRNSKSSKSARGAESKSDKRTDSTKGAKRAPARRGKAAPAKARSQAKGERKGLGKFVRDVRVEMSKVTWPTRSELMQSTLVVIVAVAIAALFTYGVDEVFSHLITFIIPK